MYYAVSHLTIYKYSEAISDSVMELRMQPRSELNQRCVRFKLEISPNTKSNSYKDYLGNVVHSFDIPAPHKRLAIKSEAVVEVRDYQKLPESLSIDAWEQIDSIRYDRDYYDFTLEGQFSKNTSLLQDFAKEIAFERRSDPLSLLRELNAQIYENFDYAQDATKVDSPIDVALAARRGVCQDFTHIMLTLVRQLGIPARYVSGYLFHERKDRSVPDASHAWLEAYLPDLGWIGFDPTNNLIEDERHIRVGIANDYAGASPSRGVFKGTADTELEVRVQVSKLDELPMDESQLAPELVMPRYELIQQTQQQQQ